MLTIVIMDPDSGIRLFYASELSEEGYEVVTCGDASGLIELIGLFFYQVPADANDRHNEYNNRQQRDRCIGENIPGSTQC